MLLISSFSVNIYQFKYRKSLIILICIFCDMIQYLMSFRLSIRISKSLFVIEMFIKLGKLFLKKYFLISC